MITVKVQCGCGQRYAFDVEPVNGRMPSLVACPVCGVDGTAAANEIIAQSSPPPPPAASPGVRLSMPAPSAAPDSAAPMDTRTAPISQAAEDGDGEKWKWWYFVLAGICFAGYAIWQAYDQHRVKPLGQLFFAVLCIAIGIWDFQHKRKRRRLRQ